MHPEPPTQSQTSDPTGSPASPLQDPLSPQCPEPQTLCTHFNTHLAARTRAHAVQVSSRSTKRESQVARCRGRCPLVVSVRLRVHLTPNKHAPKTALRSASRQFVAGKSHLLCRTSSMCYDPSAIWAGCACPHAHAREWLVAAHSPQMQQAARAAHDGACIVAPNST